MKLKDKLSRLWERFLYYETLIEFFVKENKRIIIPLLIVVILVVLPILNLVLTICDPSFDEPFSYTFRQERNNVEKVEICSYQHVYNRREGGTRIPLVSLSNEEIDKLWSDIPTLECKEFFPLDPILDYGDILIAITYCNGEVELIGVTNIGWISPDGDLTTSTYCFGIEEICAIISQYADAKLLAHHSEYFR